VSTLVCSEVAVVDTTDGRSVLIVCAPENIYVDQRFLDHAPTHWLAVGDGIMTLRGVNGTVSYGLHDYEPKTRSWRGTRGGCDLQL
jgi:hypothetical protein